jgi:hypothetical protein
MDLIGTKGDSGDPERGFGEGVLCCEIPELLATNVIELDSAVYDCGDVVL